MRPSILLPAMLTLLLAACGGAPQTNTAPGSDADTSTPAGLTEVQQRVIDLAPRQRDGVLFRAIRDGDAECQGIAGSVRQADQEGRPVWAVRCSDGPAYLIAIGPDGVAQVTKVSGDRAGA